MTESKTKKVSTPTKKSEMPEFTSLSDFKAWFLKLSPEDQKSEAVVTAAEELITKLQKG